MAVLNPANRGAYSEEYDIAALRELAEMAKRDMCEYKHVPYSGNAKRSVPDGSYSDLSCNVWSLMNELILHGIKIADEIKKQECEEMENAKYELLHEMCGVKIDNVRLKEENARLKTEIDYLRNTLHGVLKDLKEINGILDPDHSASK